MSRKHDIEYVRVKVQEKGYELISEEYIGNKSKIILKDVFGYFYYLSFNNFIKQNKLDKFSHFNPYSIQNIKLWLKLNNINLELLSNEYIKCDQKLLFKDTEGYFYNISSNSLFSGNLPRKFGTENSYTIQNIKLWCKLNNKPFDLIDNQKYKGNDKKLKWQCLKPECGEVFEASLNPILQNGGCGFCHGKQIGLSNCLATKNPELAKEWHLILNGDLTPWDVTVSGRNYVYWECPTCHYEWYAKIASRNTGSGCPKCNESKGEKKIDIILTKYNIPHDSQYKFDNLIGVGGGLLKFDKIIFWDENQTQLRMLVEYDGEQHYKWIKGMMTKKQFETLKLHDELKNKYCKKNNIKLIRIPYWDFNNIESILQRELNLSDIKLAI